MNKYVFHLTAILCLSLQFNVFAEADDKSREYKIEQILRIQDTRSIFNESLIHYLADTDAVVREKAVLACGSMQDTSMLGLLVDRLTEDSNQRVQYVAAFAIGQTATNLCRESKRTLAHDLIWARIDKVKGSARDRLIEEIGKFGTEEDLLDLVGRFGVTGVTMHNESLTNSIARFAIRGIVNREAIQYLLTFIRPDDYTPWQVVYALQRIGNHQEIRSNLEIISSLFKHRDPLVRMNLATLLGKVRDEKICIEPLQKLAEFDNDWRVRVNAFKALSNYNLKGREDIVQIFRRTFFAGNTNLAVTAISAFGATGLKKSDAAGIVKEAFLELEKIALNKDGEYQWQLQAEAVIAAARLEGKEALQFITPDNNQQLLTQLITAMGITGSTDVSVKLFGYLDENQPMLYRAALDGLLELSRKNPADSSLINRVYDAAINALAIRDVAIAATAASILGDSLFLRTSSVEKLVDALERTRIPDDIEAMQEIVSTLSKLKDVRAIDALRNQLSQRDRSVALAAASALKSITGQDYSSGISQYNEPIFTDFDFQYLQSLKDTIRVKMETIRGDVVMELYKNYAPFTVMSFLKLSTQRGFYRALSFHRIVPNFVVQGGDPRGDGWGGPGYSIRSEFSPLTYETGMIGMASSGKDTEGSQFFITQSPQPHLDGRYTIFGKVVSGMDVVNKLQLDDHIFDLKIQ